MPSPVEAFPCGSRSTTSVGWPTAASAVPRLMAVVVLPTPPFWLATTNTRGPRFVSAPRLGSLVSDTVQLPNFKDDTGGIGPAWMPFLVHTPRFTCFRQFNLYILSL